MWKFARTAEEVCHLLEAKRLLEFTALSITDISTRWAFTMRPFSAVFLRRKSAYRHTDTAVTLINSDTSS
jgi:hypothetical protein